MLQFSYKETTIVIVYINLRLCNTQLGGATYMDVHKAGGGIHFTVGQVRAASEDDLYTDLKQRATHMIAAGTTLVEVKSGYGLDADTEIKMLAVIERAKNDSSLAIDISSTFCGAHAVPKYVEVSCGLPLSQSSKNVSFWKCRFAI